MRAIVNTGPGRLEMLEMPLPEPRAGEVRVRTGACAICATDLAMIAGWKRTPFGAVPGHEWAGTVDAVGPGVDITLVGKRCVADNVWSTGGEVGFEHPGGYAGFFVTQATNVRTLPDAFDLVTATLIEPLAVCVRGLSRLAEVSSPLVVFGDGPIGLLTLMLLADRRLSGVTLVGGRDRRLALATEFGASVTLNYHAARGDLAAAVRRSCDASAFRCLIEASGSAAAMEAAMDLAGPDARVLVLGDYGAGRASFDWNTLLHKELRLIGSNASAGAWDEAVNLAVSGRLPLGSLVSHVIPAERFSEGVNLMRGRSDDVLKVVMRWDTIVK
jgi:threonine dehydrogenase-like Zn-dependent dehydrogenase